VLSIAACVLCLWFTRWETLMGMGFYLANSLQVIVARLYFDWSFQWLYFDLLNSAANWKRPHKMHIDHHIAVNAPHQCRVSCPILCCSYTPLIITAKQRRICFHQLPIIWKGTLNTSFEHIFHNHHLLVSTCPWHFFVGTQLLVMVTTLLTLTYTWHVSKLSTNRCVLQHHIKQIQKTQK
jgi:hypothetical protein